MKKFLWICMIAVLGFSCIHPRAQQESFKMPDMPTIEAIYNSFAQNYLGIWNTKVNCGDDHGGQGSHDITGVIEFKDNGQFILEFVTIEVPSDSFVFQTKREGYWVLAEDGSFIQMAVIHELNSQMEIIVTDPVASLKTSFKIYLNELNIGLYTDERKRVWNFTKDGYELKSEQNKLDRI